MKKFEVLEHITDLKIKVFGKDKKELFKNAMLGMFEAARYETEIKSKKSENKNHTSLRSVEPCFRQGINIYSENKNHTSLRSVEPCFRQGINIYSENKIKIKSFDFDSLLVDFLSEILYLCETQNQVYQDVVFKKFSDTELEAILIGQRQKRMGVQIKGVTYHGLEIKQKDNKSWEATILFDI